MDKNMHMTMNERQTLLLQMKVWMDGYIGD